MTRLEGIETQAGFENGNPDQKTIQVDETRKYLMTLDFFRFYSLGGDERTASIYKNAARINAREMVKRGLAHPLYWFLAHMEDFKFDFFRRSR